MGGLKHVTLYVEVEGTSCAVSPFFFGDKFKLLPPDIRFRLKFTKFDFPDPAGGAYNAGFS